MYSDADSVISVEEAVRFATSAEELRRMSVRTRGKHNATDQEAGLNLRTNGDCEL